MTEIQKFYNGRSIFITGGTGYLGKILIEKLLRSCPGIKTIYILTRPKKGKTIQERINEMIDLPMFEPLRAINPDFENKIIPLAGDLMDPDLGLSYAAQELIKKEVAIVFHAAATTRFDEPLNVALKVNVESVKSLIDICKQSKNLEAFVYVSTAFSNCIYEHIEEKVYPTPLPLENSRDAVKIIEHSNFSEEEEQTFTNLILGKFPNTYCFTKAIAEDLVSKYSKDLSVSIFRFSIALSSLREPIPGWIDIAQGFSQVIIKISLGLIRVICIKGEANMETVPIDFACNCLIASGHEAGINKKNAREDLKVYNYVSSRDNSITWNSMREILKSLRYEISMENTVYYPEVMYVKNWKLWLFLHYVLHFIPAILGDIILRVMGKRPKFHKVFVQGTKLANALVFFTKGQWLFDNENVKLLWNKLNEDDKKLFNFDITDFTGKEMLRAYIFGVKKYFMHENMTPKALKKVAAKMRRLFYIHQVVRTIFYVSVLRLFVKTYYILFNRF